MVRDNIKRGTGGGGEVITQTKTVTPTTSQQTVTPDAGKYLSEVTVEAIQVQSKSAVPTTSPQNITPDAGKYLDSVAIGAIQTQTKSAAPSESAQSIVPDSGKYLSKVDISAIQIQTKSAMPTTSAQSVTPDNGKYLNRVDISAIQTQTKSVTPATSAQTVTPDAGKYLSGVTVAAIPNQRSGNQGTITPTGAQQIFYIPAGWYDGSAYITVEEYINRVTVTIESDSYMNTTTSHEENPMKPGRYYTITDRDYKYFSGVLTGGTANREYTFTITKGANWSDSSISNYIYFGTLVSLSGNTVTIRADSNGRAALLTRRVQTSTNGLTNYTSTYFDQTYCTVDSGYYIP